MSQIRTHEDIDHDLCGEPVSVDDREAVVAFDTSGKMAVDEHGLVHGGFIFGLADHAAMLAVNDPNVVLGSANVQFSAPVTVGERVEATARVVESDGKKRLLEVSARTGDTEVLSGTFTAFVLDQHVLES